MESEDNPRAGIPSSMINILNTILGSGMLAMPHAIASVGLIPGIMLIALSGLASGFGLNLLAYTAGPLGRHASFNAASKMTYPNLAILFDTAIAVKCFGVAVSYLVIIGDLMPEVAIKLFQLGEDSLLRYRQTWITLAMLVIIPFCFLRRLDSLKYTSLIALFAVLYLFILVIYFFFQPTNNSAPEKEWYLFDMKVEFLKKLPIYVFAFTCHQNIFAVHNELRRNTLTRVNTVIFSSIFISACVYWTVGVLGYIMFGVGASSNLLKDLDDGELVTIARVAVTILVTFSYALQCHPSRASFEKVFTRLHELFDDWKKGENRYAPLGQESEETNDALLVTENKTEPAPGVDLDHSGAKEMSNMMFFSLTVGIIVVSYVIAFFVSELGLVLSFVGSTGSTTICYILPGIFYLKMTEKEPWHFYRIAAAVLVVSGLIVMPLCVAFLFINV